MRFSVALVALWVVDVLVGHDAEGTQTLACLIEVITSVSSTSVAPSSSSV